MEPSTLKQRLDELDSAFGEQAKRWDAQFNRVWNKQLPALRQAVEVASTEALSPTTRDALHEHLNQLCTMYLSMGDDAHRAEFRKSVASRKHLLWACREHIDWAARRIKSPADVEWLRAGLAATSIEDARIDFRDTLMNLGELYIAASTHGIEPMQYFKEVAVLSSSEETQWKAFRSTRHVLEHFDDTAFFRADVEPYLGQNGLSQV